MAYRLTLTITVQDADALRAAIEDIAYEAEDADYDAQYIGDLYASGSTEGGFTIAAECEEVPA